jgi:hypothetical protein
MPRATGCEQKNVEVTLRSNTFRRFHLRDDRFRAFAAAVIVHGHRRAAARQFERDRASDAGARSRHERNLSFE